MKELWLQAWTCAHCSWQHTVSDPDAVEFFCPNCESWTRFPNRESV